MSDIDNLSNKDLLAKCREYGLPVVPVTDSTRKVIIRRLESAILEKSNKSAKTVAPKCQNSSRKTISANKVRHGHTNSKNIVSQQREPIQTKRRTLPPRKTGSVAVSNVEGEDYSKRDDENSASLAKTVISVTSYVHEVETPIDGESTDTDDDDVPTRGRKTVRGRKKSLSQAYKNNDVNRKTDVKRPSIQAKGRSIPTMVSDAGCQTDVPDFRRESTLRKKESESHFNQNNDVNTKTNLKRRSIQVTGRTTTTVSNVSQQTQDDGYSKPKQVPVNEDDSRSRRILSLTKSQVVTTSYIHQMDTSRKNDEDEEVVVQQSNPGKRRRICTSPVSCPPPIYESSFGKLFVPSLSEVQPHLTQTQLKTTSYLDARSSHNSPSTSYLLPRSTLGGSAGSFGADSTSAVMNRRIVESSSTQPTVNTLYPKLDQFYKQPSPRDSSRGEPMDTDSTWESGNPRINSIENPWRYL